MNFDMCLKVTQSYLCLWMKLGQTEETACVNTHIVYVASQQTIDQRTASICHSGHVMQGDPGFLHYHKNCMWI